MDSIDFAQVLNYALAILLSLTVHEAAHAWVASLRGDQTAKSLGRLTLNPLAHIDWFGTVLMPLIAIVTRLPLIGWAKPVPVDTRQLKNPRWDYVLVAAAGPLSNLALCTGAIVLLFGYQAFGQELLPESSALYPLVELTQAMVLVNAFLAFFNLIPLPPLDGATVFGALLPERWAQRYDELVAPYGAFVLMALIAAGGLHWLPGLARGFVDLVAGSLAFLAL